MRLLVRLVKELGLPESCRVSLITYEMPPRAFYSEEIAHLLSDRSSMLPWLNSWISRPERKVGT